MIKSFNGLVDPPTMTPRRRRPAWKEGRGGRTWDKGAI
jgi:hypothetical protein